MSSNLQGPLDLTPPAESLTTRSASTATLADKFGEWIHNSLRAHATNIEFNRTISGKMVITLTTRDDGDGMDLDQLVLAIKHGPTGPKTGWAFGGEGGKNAATNMTNGLWAWTTQARGCPCYHFEYNKDEIIRKQWVLGNPSDYIKQVASPFKDGHGTILTLHLNPTIAADSPIWDSVVFELGKRYGLLFNSAQNPLTITFDNKVAPQQDITFQHVTDKAIVDNIPLDGKQVHTLSLKGGPSCIATAAIVSPKFRGAKGKKYFCEKDSGGVYVFYKGVLLYQDPSWFTKGVPHPSENHLRIFIYLGDEWYNKIDWTVAKHLTRLRREVEMSLFNSFVKGAKASLKNVYRKWEEQLINKGEVKARTSRKKEICECPFCHQKAPTATFKFTGK